MFGSLKKICTFALPNTTKPNDW